MATALLHSRLQQPTSSCYLGAQVLRVWTPPGYSMDSPPPPGGHFALFMNDGKNMFEDWLAHQVSLGVPSTTKSKRCLSS